MDPTCSFTRPEQEMTSTTHVATSCLITVISIQSCTNNVQTILVVTGGSLLAHLILDVFPHGYIATPSTLFKKIVPTVLELVPGPIILIVSIWLFEHAFLFLIAALFGILPDIITVLFYKRKERISRIPPILFIHNIHRNVHWFETENADGTVSFPLPNAILLSFEAILITSILILLFR